MKVLPATRLGKWSIWLTLAFLLLTMFNNIVMDGILNQDGGTSYFDNPLRNTLISIGIASAVSALITGVISVWKYKERSFLIALPIVIGLLITLFVIFAE